MAAPKIVKDFIEETERQWEGPRTEQKVSSAKNQLSAKQAGQEFINQLVGSPPSAEKLAQMQQKEAKEKQQNMASYQGFIQELRLNQQKRDQIDKEYGQREILAANQPIQQQLQKKQERAKPNMLQDTTPETAGGKKT